MHQYLKDNTKRKRIAVTGGLLVVCIVATSVFLRQQLPPELPRSIVQLHLAEELHGEKATEMVNELHHKSVAPKQNVIGKYQSSYGNAMLYLSAYPDFDEAKEQLEKMANRIKEDNGVFQHFRETTLEDKKVFMCLGLGQAHYFFLGGTNLYWFAVDIPIAQASVRELIKVTESK